MIKRVLAAFALACAMAAAPGALAQQPVGGPIQVRTGDVYTIDITYTQTTAFGGENIEAVVRQVYALHILDAESRRWRYVPVSLSYDFPQGLGAADEAGAADNFDWGTVSEALSAMLRIATDVGFDCTVDEYGRCIDMTNWSLWSNRAENLIIMFDAFARLAPAAPPVVPVAVDEEIEAQPPTPGQKSGENTDPIEDEVFAETATPAPDWRVIRGPVLVGLRRMLDEFNSRDAASMMSSVYMPAFVQGRTLTPRQTIEMVDEYDMPFGAPPLRFNSTLRLDRVDRRNNTMTVLRRSALDVESARATSRGVTAFVSEVLIQPAAAAAGGEAPPSVESIQQMVDTMLSAVSYQESTTGVIDLSTGLARETTTDITMALAGMGGAGEPLEVHGRFVTRVSAGAPDVPRLPQQ